MAKRQELCSEERVQIDLMEQSEQGTKLRVDGALAWEVWRGSLSHDAAEDRIVRFVDDCGNWGECAHAAYLACREGHFVLVYGPDYFVSLEPLDVPDESGFARLRGAARNEDAEEPGVDTVILRFRDGAYEPQPLIGGRSHRAGSAHRITTRLYAQPGVRWRQRLFDRSLAFRRFRRTGFGPSPPRRNAGTREKPGPTSRARS